MATPQHREIYRARDQQYYTRVEQRVGILVHAGPFLTAEDALSYLQQAFQVGEQFIFDDSGRRPAPVTASVSRLD